MLLNALQMFIVHLTILVSNLKNCNIIIRNLHFQKQYLYLFWRHQDSGLTNVTALYIYFKNKIKLVVTFNFLELTKSTKMMKKFIRKVAVDINILHRSKNFET